MIPTNLVFRTASVSRRGHRREPRRSPLALALLVLLATGCAPVSPPPVAAPPPSTLVPVDTGGRGVFLVAPDHQLGRYDALRIEEVGLEPSAHQRRLSDRDADRIRTLLIDAVAGSQDPRRLGLTDQPGPCVLGVRIFVTNLALNVPRTESTSTTRLVDSFGEATLILELRDSVSERPLARFLQRRDLGGGVADGRSHATLQRLERVVGRSIREMGAELQALTPPSRGEWDANCRGGLTRVAFGQH